MKLLLFATTLLILPAGLIGHQPKGSLHDAWSDWLINNKSKEKEVNDDNEIVSNDEDKSSDSSEE
jgi:hypothetical protein